MRLLGSDLFLELELKYRTCAKTAVIPTAQFRRNRLRLRFKISERRVFSHDFDFGIKYERTKRYRVEKITREIIWYKHRQLTVRYDIYLLFLYNDVNVVKFLACKIFYFTLMRRHLLARAWNVFCHCFVSRRSSHSSRNKERELGWILSVEKPDRSNQPSKLYFHFNSFQSFPFV